MIGPEFVVNIGDSMQGDDPAKTEEQWREGKAIWACHLTQKQHGLVGNQDV
ncbi:MAG: hypothetical protein NTV52_04380 [Acidobacteria bacterium]|nr:hypothetical protein [Acidobacteriota bacterium]